ncbi:MAG: hypothetical protein JNL67_19955 [Planctomycetaceae bacterium]|nr:hypothetical protein [Planctomycetaceae bacterium]
MNSPSLQSAPLEPLKELSLTPFERFQYWETRVDYPNQIVAVLDFVGRLNVPCFIEAVATVLPRHPLLYSRLKIVGNSPVAFVWPVAASPHGDVLERSPLAGQAVAELDNESLVAALVRLGLQDYVRMERKPDDWVPGQLHDLPNVQPELGPAFCLTIQFSRTQCRWVMQTHHVVCDGLGGLQSIRELLQVYHWRSTDPQQPFPLRSLPIERLINRGRMIRGAASLGSRLAKLPMKWIGLFGASKFLWRRPVGLSASADQEEGGSRHGSEITWVDGGLSGSQSRRLRQVAKEFGVTVNSLLLAQWLATLHRFRVQHGLTTPQSEDCYRLMIPTNERTGGDVALSACNQVSMVYVDRWPREMEHLDGLAAGIDYEMSIIRRWGLSGTFLLALRVLGWFPSLLRWYARRPSCWATSYVTNLGPILDRLRVGQEGEKSRVGELTLHEVRLLPPLRPALPAALAVHVYAGQVRLTLHYDRGEITSEHAGELLQSLLNRLRTL